MEVAGLLQHAVEQQLREAGGAAVAGARAHVFAAAPFGSTSPPAMTPALRWSPGLLRRTPFRMKSSG
jgi:hypothetical protein